MQLPRCKWAQQKKQEVQARDQSEEKLCVHNVPLGCSMEQLFLYRDHMKHT
jgi:hypothetical protein